MRCYYAVIDTDNICRGVSDLKGKPMSGNAIEISSYDISLIGKKYVDGIWEDMLQPEPLSDQEQAVLDTAINTDYLVCLADLGL